MEHFSHDHPFKFILKFQEDPQTYDGSNHSDEINHPMHPQHPLTLLSSPSYAGGEFLCDRCSKIGMGFVYNCFKCNFDLDPICASASGYELRKKGMQEEMTHFSHDHPLILKHERDSTEHSGKITSCDACSEPISGPFYSCGECPYFLHKECTELLNQINHPTHPQHPLFLSSKSNDTFQCDMCREKGTGFYYRCYSCHFDLDLRCAEVAFQYPILQHFSHKHPLVLKAVEPKRDDGTIQSNRFISWDGRSEHPWILKAQGITCHGCSEPISGPCYSCRECSYFLHKVCAELPNQMNHPMHLHHTLTLRANISGISFSSKCSISRKIVSQFFYNCSQCPFVLELTSASAFHVIEDKCHMHPLTPIQHHIRLPSCHICRTNEKGFSYKCNVCPFWVHQNCTLWLPKTTKYSDHDHRLTLLKSVPPEYESVSHDCDICHGEISMFYCVYYCAQCTFFAHVGCVRSEEAPLPGGSDLAHLPVKQKTTDLILWFSENYTDRDAITNLILGFDESFIDRDNNIKFFHHGHPLFLMNDQVGEETCEACALPISAPSYGCINCHYFIHKSCTEVPKQILHPAHPQHPISLYPCGSGLIKCSCCYQRCNGLGYKCFQCEGFLIDIKCASLLKPLKHQGHRHYLIPSFKFSSSWCDACRKYKTKSLICSECYFELCFECAMAPPMMKHRSDIHPFLLAYSPPEDSPDRYICELCGKDLNPKLWFYLCRICHRFSHISCMLDHDSGANIKHGYDEHSSMLTDLISFFSENYGERDVISNLILGFSENYVYQYFIMNKKIDFFGHGHSLFLIDDHISEELCEACALPISPHSYGCFDCGYFIHKSCIELTKQILHPAHPHHQISLWLCKGFFRCSCCDQWSNGLAFKCFQCEGFVIDIKCASLLRHVKHEAHKHPLVPKFIQSGTCKACGHKTLSNCTLQCKAPTCSFSLCFVCAMAPPKMMHWYDKHPFELTYAPPINHHKEYICDLCEGNLNPKGWFYHCGLCDQFTHVHCMILRAGDSNIKYGKCYEFEVDEHKLALVSCTYRSSLCDKCGFPMRARYSVGLECKTCDYKIHLLCALDMPTSLPN